MAEIVWLGHACFRLKSKDAVIITDPYDKTLGLGALNQKAEIVTVSHNHPHHNSVASVKGDPMVLSGPGEYEVGGVFINGVWTFADDEGGATQGRNTIFLYQLDDLSVCHLGALGHTLNSHQLEGLENVDVLLVPVGGHSSLTAAKASEVISQIEPRVVIPMHYSIGRETTSLDSVDRFTKEMGLKDWTTQERFAMKASDLTDTTQVVVLEAKI
jgi:L-ascorbate metabolism protein UlaG (beta-lactamase superfamily)